MAIALYDISIACYRQALGGVAGFLEKGLAHCEQKKIDPDGIVQTRLYPDMLPFSFQIHSVAHHSLGAIKGVESGVFTPPKDLPELDYAGLQDKIAETLEALGAYTPAQVNAWEGRDMVFQIGDRKVPFTAEDFVLSFSLPNVHFHAATAYDILRIKGAPLGKRDFMGSLRTKA
ncbi:MAG: DUF1993 domain-containing protein [Pseudomonadales bacterium]